MTWQAFFTAITPSVHSLIVAVVSALLGVGGTMYATSGKKETEPPSVPQVQVTRPMMQDQTKLQLQGIDDKLDTLVRVALRLEAARVK